MPPIHRITSLDLPALQPYRTLRRSQEHFSQGIFVAEGEKVVRRFLASGLPAVSLLMTDEWFAQLFPGGAASMPCEVFIAEKKLLETIVGFRMHQGIMAVGRVPAEPTLDDLVRKSPSPRLFASLDGLVFAETVGVVVRNCAAFGVHGILVGKNSASPYLRRAVRNSMGAAFQIPVIHVQRLPEPYESLPLTSRPPQQS
ncbi:MAG: tRNA/rRNA methyltransferase (SpoU) [Bacteroidetes bacterium]|nr:tRNA/rRNA methyltransferase (SpoU) [Bacteroidota bacterium]